MRYVMLCLCLCRVFNMFFIEEAVCVKPMESQGICRFGTLLCSSSRGHGSCFPSHAGRECGRTFLYLQSFGPGSFGFYLGWRVANRKSCQYAISRVSPFVGAQGEPEECPPMALLSEGLSFSPCPGTRCPERTEGALAQTSVEIG